MHATAFTSGSARCRPVVAHRCAAARAVREAPAVPRREALAALAAAVAVAAPGEARAFLGFGEDQDKKYTDRTRDLLKAIARVKTLGEDADKEAEVKELKREMNEWTAAYRTDRTFGGRPSFSNMYSAVNALAGHWNSFGADAPIPKKRLTRIDKELEDVEKFLSRGR